MFINSYFALVMVIKITHFGIIVRTLGIMTTGKIKNTFKFTYFLGVYECKISKTSE